MTQMPGAAWGSLAPPALGCPAGIRLLKEEATLNAAPGLSESPAFWWGMETFLPERGSFLRPEHIVEPGSALLSSQ